MCAVSWHALPIEKALKRLETEESGLTEAQARARLEKYGRNVLAEKKKEHPLKILLSQFTNVLVLILIVAAAVSFFIGETVEAVAIAFIVLLNAGVGFILEYNAERSMEALKRMSVPKAKVRRNSHVQFVGAQSLVPGDIVMLEAGDRVPADCRILSAINLKIDEAALTGESDPVTKNTEACPAKTAVADRRNLAYMNTAVTYGRGVGLVVETGMSTQFGQVAALLQGVEKEQTPLMARLDALGSLLAKMVIVIAVVMFVVGISLGDVQDVTFLKEMFLQAVALAVAAVPEGLPIVVTVTLAIGMTMMAHQNARMRRMAAVETLGSTSVICSDKTGTLTRNEMTVRAVRAAGQEYTVSGHGYFPKGAIENKGERVAHPGGALSLLLENCVLCNNAELKKDGSHMGDPTELALLVLAAKNDLHKEKLLSRFEFVDEVPFDSTRKRMSVLYKQKGSNATHVFAKGAAESILSISTLRWSQEGPKPMSTGDRRAIIEQAEQMAKKGLRVLAFAHKTLEKGETKQEAEEGLAYLGLVGMMDAPRKSAKEAIAECTRAGIEVKMVTGDHPETARAVAQEIGLLKKDSEVATGQALDEMDNRELAKRIANIAVFARVNPEHKVRILDALKGNGMSVSMTGDGVNDAPALKRADIGVAMGSGTDVSKEASDMVITDDNFATIVQAVESGRRIYSNIRSFVKYLISANAAEVIVIAFVVIVGSLFKDLGWGVILAPVQILWLNLVTDGLPATALAFEPTDKDVMKTAPRPKDEHILHGMAPYILVAGLLGAAVTLAAYVMHLPGGQQEGHTAAFLTLALFELVYVFNCRGEKTVFELNPFSNRALLLAVISSLVLIWAAIYIPLFTPFFGTVALTAASWPPLIALAATALFIPYLARGVGRFFPSKLL